MVAAGKGEAVMEKQQNARCAPRAVGAMFLGIVLSLALSCRGEEGGKVTSPKAGESEGATGAVLAK